MAVRMADTAEPMGNFPIAKAKHIEFEDGEKLQEKLDNGTLGSGGGEPYDDTVVRGLIDTNKTDIADLNTKIGTTAMGTTATDVTGAVAEVNGNLLDNVSFSADYKNIVLNRKNGLNPYSIPISAIINHAKLIELADVDVTDIGNGKTLAYDAATQKHKYVSSSGTDELVKMEASADANYLANLIDNQTIVNDNGVLKVKKLDGQEVTIAEINYLKGLTMNVMDLVNAFANGGVKVHNTPVATYADLTTLDRSKFIDGISYIVYVLADESHAGAKTTYLCDKTNATFFGNADSQRNFTTDPIDLANEVTGKLPVKNIDVDSLWALLTVDDTYKTLTATDNVFGTHGAKAMYDELTTAIGAKANAADLTAHTDDTDIHVTTTDKTKWDKVDEKVDKTSILTAKNSGATDDQVYSAKAINTEVVKKTDIVTTIDSTSTDDKVGSAKSVYDITSNFLKTYTSIEQLGLTKGSETIEDIANSMGDKTKLITLIFEADNNMSIYPYRNGTLFVEKINIYRVNLKFCEDITSNVYVSTYHGAKGFTGWKKVCTTSVADVPVTTITNTLVSTKVAFQASDSNAYLYVKNGTCYVSIWDVTILEEANLEVLFNNAPKAAFMVGCALHNGYESFGHVFVTTNSTEIRLNAPSGLVGKSGYCSFSYPVAES